MATRKTDTEIIEGTHNSARFFTENRQLSWVLLIATVAWGVYSYQTMPKRKDPAFPAGTVVAICPWPGASAENVEQLVTQKIEEKIAENPKVERLESISRGSLSIVYSTVDEALSDAEMLQEFDDISLRLATITDLPPGSGPVQFLKDFRDTGALMLTVASPKADELEIGIRAHTVQRAIEQVRSQFPPDIAQSRVTGVACFPSSLNPKPLRRRLEFLARFMVENNFASVIRPIVGPGFIGLDATGELDDAAIKSLYQDFIRERLHASELHPDVWELAVIRDPKETKEKLAAVAGDKYTYRQLDDFSDLISKTLQTSPLVSKVNRSGILEERVFLDYSQERLASYGIQPSLLDKILEARNIVVGGGLLDAGGRNIIISPSGEFASEEELANVILSTSPSGHPLRLGDLVDISREYENPPRFLNFYTWQENGQWHRTRAATLAVFMRAGGRIGEFGEGIDSLLSQLKERLPDDLILARTGDQRLQTEENIGLFMQSLYEAILLVVLVALIGFREWRSAMVVAASIPLALAMTFGFMRLLGLDLQQVSIASLILALGLLVDDPIVAADAIKRELAAGHRPIVAAWLGPTKLVKAITYSTITVIVAYLPLLLVQGLSGHFIYSLPLVIACALISSRIISMTFIPFLGFYLLRSSKKPEPSIEERRTTGFSGMYYRLGNYALESRWSVLLWSTILFVGSGIFLVSQLKIQFFPKDLSYLSYVNVWLPEDSGLAVTNEAARQVERVIEDVAREYGEAHPREDGQPAEILESITTFVGGGGPRFWFSLLPELPQLNYAQVVIRLRNREDTHPLVVPLQRAFSAKIPGAVIDMRQLETSEPILSPVEVRISGDNIQTLRELADQVKEIFRGLPEAARIRDSWGNPSFVVNLDIDPDRANLAGFSNLDVAGSSAVAMSGAQVTTLREGAKEIPVTVRLRMEERAQLSDLENLYVYSLQGPQRVPLKQVSSINYQMQMEKILRRNQFRTISVSCFPVPGRLPSEVLSAARPQLLDWEKTLPVGYKMEIGGEEEIQIKRFKELVIVMGISIILIYLTLVIQFSHAIKPFLVFAAIPYSMVGALAALAIMDSPFGFMPFLGIVSLIGVIVSHVIVLFDFVEELREEGASLRDGLVDAGIIRLRPVFITVASTVIALIPLAQNGGPLWEALCYAQIGGLLVANYLTKVLVPAVYAIFVLDLKLVKWEA